MFGGNTSVGGGLMTSSRFFPMILVYFWAADYSTVSYGVDTKSLFNTLQTLPNLVQKRELKYLYSHHHQFGAEYRKNKSRKKPLWSPLPMWIKSLAYVNLVPGAIFGSFLVVRSDGDPNFPIGNSDPILPIGTDFPDRTWQKFPHPIRPITDPIPIGSDFRSDSDPIGQPWPWLRLSLQAVEPIFCSEQLNFQLHPISLINNHSLSRWSTGDTQSFTLTVNYEIPMVVAERNAKALTWVKYGFIQFFAFFLGKFDSIGRRNWLVFL